mmetsp:Transcript_6034/g.11805  ORF Transcript_6034/g.11805 Transcript_6034/m.11805 type:complete len:228 (-) Transcript_6034:136-819(-)
MTQGIRQSLRILLRQHQGFLSDQRRRAIIIIIITIVAGLLFILGAFRKSTHHRITSRSKQYLRPKRRKSKCSTERIARNRSFLWLKQPLLCIPLHLLQSIRARMPPIPHILVFLRNYLNSFRGSSSMSRHLCNRSSCSISRNTLTRLCRRPSTTHSFIGCSISTLFSVIIMWYNGAWHQCQSLLNHTFYSLCEAKNIVQQRLIPCRLTHSSASINQLLLYAFLNADA